MPLPVKMCGAYGFRRFSDADRARFHQAALAVLATTGIRVDGKQARTMLGDAGCQPQMQGDTVRIPARVVEDAIAAAPKELVIYDRNGNERLHLHENRTYFGMGTTAVFFHDTATAQRRKPTIEDIATAARAGEALPNMDFLAPPVILSPASDLPADKIVQRGFNTLLDNTTKPLLALGNDAATLRDNLELAAEAVGGRSALRRRPFVIAAPSVISPLLYDRDTLDRIFAAVDFGVPVRCGSSPLAGGTAPVTAAGMIVICLAECLGALVIAQLRKPGTPVVIGTTPGILDMKTGNLSYSAPETSVFGAAIAEMGRHYRLPVFSAPSVCSSLTVDPQAAVELMLGVTGAILSGAGMVGHIGCLEAGLSFSLQAAVLGDEIIDMLRRCYQPVPIDDETLALEAIQRVGAGGHFVDSAHTLRHFRREQWQPSVMSRLNIDTWMQSGHRSFWERLNARLQALLGDKVRTT